MGQFQRNVRQTFSLSEHHDKLKLIAHQTEQYLVFACVALGGFV